MLKKIFHFLLWLLILILLAATLTLLVWWRKWPWWYGITIALLLLGCWLGIIFAHRLIVRRREKAFVRRVIDQDEKAISDFPRQEQMALRDLQIHWKESIELLRSSHLRRVGNPLYVLPWYLVLGETGAGKSSAVQASGLSSTLTEISYSSGLPSTANCDWWFFEEAIILDAAGRYAVPLDAAVDRPEWERFLSLLARYRKREPLNGLIVAVAADKLLSSEPEQLRLEGQNMRHRADQLMRVLGASFPVYVMVTKLDLIFGFGDFSRRIPGSALEQAMGYINAAEDLNCTQVFNQAIQGIVGRLSSIRSSLVSRHEQGEFLMFPTEFKGLVAPLQTFVSGLFAENSYQETPLLRGLFFSSAKQEGESVCSCTQIFSSVCSLISHPMRGIFLRDFFKTILPADRGLFRPIAEFLRWKRLTFKLGTGAWLMFCLGIAGLLSMSYLQNMTTLTEFTEDFVHPPSLSGELALDLINLDRMRIEILNVQDRNRNWALPRLGLDSSLRVEEKLKQRYVKLVEKGILKPVDARVEHNIQQVSSQTSSQVVADYAGSLVARIFMLNMFLQHKTIQNQAVILKSSSEIFNIVDREILPEISSRFGPVYLAYVKWKNNDSLLARNMQDYRSILVGLLQHKGLDLHWLVQDWISNTDDISLKYFWAFSSSGKIKDRTFVPGAYTVQGMKNISRFITYIEQALGENKNLIASHKQKFWTWYKDQYLLAWEKFAVYFNDGEAGLKGLLAHKNTASSMASISNAYFDLLLKMDMELAPFKKEDDSPYWVDVIGQLAEIRKIAQMKRGQVEQSLRDKLIYKGRQTVERLEGQMDREQLHILDKKIRLAKAWKEYLDVLGEFLPLVGSKHQSYKAMRAYFSGQENKDTAFFTEANSETLRIQSEMDPKNSYPWLWKIFCGPYNFLLDYALKEAGCQLQKTWDENVLGPIQDVAQAKIQKLLFARDKGLVWKFLQGPAAPFISQGSQGFYGRRVHGRQMAIYPEFFNFLYQGKQGSYLIEPSYNVRFTTQPIASSPGAELEPFACVLSVQCAQKSFRLENYNYPDSADFTWSPESCGDVELQIMLPGFSLTRTYQGAMGFALFLEDFKDGSHTFRADDFPEQSQLLAQYGIKWIRLTYMIQGAQPVVKLLDKVPASVPEEIVNCW